MANDDPSWPGLSRPSTPFFSRHRKDVVARDKFTLGPAEGRTRVRGHDDPARGEQN